MDNFVLCRSSEPRFPELHLCYCGYEDCVPLHSFGPAVRDNYLIHIILNGTGIYRVNQQTYHLSEGEGFLIEPGVQTFYQADQENPWTYVWFGFKGYEAEKIVRELGLGKNRVTFRLSHVQELKQVILSMLKNGSYSKANEYMLESQLYLLLSILMRDIEVHLGETNQGNDIVRKAVEYIEDNHAKHDLKVVDVAKYVNVERGYLYTLFKKNLQLSPKDYIVRYRLSRATELLNNTDYPMEIVAYSCGYQDPAVFSKAFKKMYQVAPSKYRQISRTTMQKNLEGGKNRLELLEAEQTDKKAGG